MPLLRPNPRLLLTSSRARLQILPNLAQQTAHPRPLTSTSPRSAGDAHGHESQYDAPGGWLFGVKPGEKYENEGWENIFVYGFVGTLLFGVVGYCYKPDTSIQTWALEEARRRLEAEGILADPDTKS